MTLKKISAVSQSVANTAKRVVVIIGSAIVFNESISGLKAIGCAVSDATDCTMYYVRCTLPIQRRSCTALMHHMSRFLQRNLTILQQYVYSLSLPPFLSSFYSNGNILRCALQESS